MPTVNGDRIRALRHVREVVWDMRWLGMTVPPLYASMAEEFQVLVRSGAYAAWVASFEGQRLGRDRVLLRVPASDPGVTSRGVV